MQHFNKKIFFATFLFTLQSSTFSIAQEVDNRIKKANTAYKLNRYEEAIRISKEVLKNDPNNIDANYICGQSTFNSGQKAASFPFYQKIYELDKNYDKFLLKYLARTYQLNYNFDSAIAIFQEYETLLHKREKGDQIIEKKLIDKRIEECLSAKELMKTPKKVIINHLGNEINSKYDDYSPIITADEKVLIFTSRRDHIDGNNFSKKDQEFYEEVFISDKKDSTWAVARTLSDNVNGRRHDACVALAPDGDKLIIYKSHNRTRGDLFYSDLKNGVWQEPVKFKGDINSKSFEPSATINSKENWIIFSSDRPGGYGGLDLYMSTLQSDGIWGKAVNLGPSINTKYDEDAPYLQGDDRTLHFSSDGHNSMGGYDIFTIVYDGEKNTWSAPENVGYPINTPNDDIYFSWNKNGTRAYFSTVRPDGMGGQDLYTIEYIKEKPIPKTVVLKGVVLDKSTKKPIASTVKVSVYSKDSSFTIGPFSSDSTTGQFSFSLPDNKSYGMQIQANDYLLFSSNDTTPSGKDTVVILKDIELQPIDKGIKVVLKNIFFDYNQSTLKAESEVELMAVVEFMKKYENVLVEISGHTDSIGSLAYNQVLSEARALAVKNRLVEIGIPQERLSNKGYNFSKPISSNQTPEGRQLNRRTEFLILENKK